jgi:hypothetical protein
VRPIPRQPQRDPASIDDAMTYWPSELLNILVTGHLGYWTPEELAILLADHLAY